MELIRLYIDENIDDKSGYTALGLVDEPAIDEGYFVFNKNKTLKTVKIALGTKKGNFKPIEGEKKILAGALMIPDLEIYRNDNGKEYNVFFSRADIEQIVLKQASQNLNNAVNEMHDMSKMVNATLYQSFIIDRALGIHPPLGQDHLPDGTWFGFVKVKDDDVYQNYIKTGIYTGFSIEGNFYEEVVNDISDAEAKFILDEFLKVNI